jgi:hypothetical protein
VKFGICVMNKEACFCGISLKQPFFTDLMVQESFTNMNTHSYDVFLFLGVLVFPAFILVYHAFDEQKTEDCNTQKDFAFIVTVS